MSTDVEAYTKEANFKPPDRSEVWVVLLLHQAEVSRTPILPSGDINVTLDGY